MKRSIFGSTIYSVHQLRLAKHGVECTESTWYLVPPGVLGQTGAHRGGVGPCDGRGVRLEGRRRV